MIALTLALSATLASWIDQPVAFAQEDPPVGDSEEVQDVAAEQLTPPVAQPGGDLPGDPVIDLVLVADGFTDPVGVAAPDDGSGRIFVIERSGTVRIVDAEGNVMEDPFMDISGSVLTAFLEQGMYDIAFHPDFAENGYVYAHFAELMRNGDSMIVRYTVSPDNPNQIDPDSSKMIMQIDQPWANHNGGELEFGPDGYLYIGSGDGGWEGDPLETGQNFNDLLGSILRIDVDVPETMAYAIPADNPFAGKSGLVELFGIPENVFANIHTEAAPEVWNYGLRNPWQFSFDRETGDLYIADVGQNHWEEIDFEPADSDGGINYGWDFLMGSHCFPIQAENCPNVGVLPIAEYEHVDGNCAVVDIGVYRGGDYDALIGIYFAGDYCSGRVWGLAQTDNNAWTMQELLDTDIQITGAGAGPDGTLYVTSCNCNYGGPGPTENPPGSLWRVAASNAVPEGATTAGHAEGAAGHEHQHDGDSEGSQDGQQESQEEHHEGSEGSQESDASGNQDDHHETGSSSEEEPESGEEGE